MKHLEEMRCVQIPHNHSHSLVFAGELILKIKSHLITNKQILEEDEKTSKNVSHFPGKIVYVLYEGLVYGQVILIDKHKEAKYTNSML